MGQAPAPAMRGVRRRSQLSITTGHNFQTDDLEVFIRLPSRPNVALRVTGIAYHGAHMPDLAWSSTFERLYAEALEYLLEDAKPTLPGQPWPQCDIKHLSALQDFLKETN
ncbi:hypothetical protein LABOLPEG_00036 [Pseudomonas phage phi 21A]|nr:hypothetical protein LABOLPEG_00036 [Pseudomonas phage phi 21A]